MQYLALKLIDIYQIILSPSSGLLMVLAPGGTCKYEITCSEYTKQQIKERGVLKGSINGLRRILSCR